MKITLAVVGKIKEKYWTMAIDEYSKRLSRYASLNICQIADEPTPDNASSLQEKQIRDREGERLLKEIAKYDRSGDTRVIALAIDGKAYDSVAFSKHLDELQTIAQSDRSIGIEHFSQRRNECVGIRLHLGLEDKPEIPGRHRRRRYTGKQLDSDRCE